MEGYGFPKTSGGLRSTAMVRLADRMRQLWGQVTTRESAYQPYKEEEEEDGQQQKGRVGEESDPKKVEGARLPVYQGGRRKSPGLQGKSEEVNLRVEAALMDSRTFLITLSCRCSLPHNISKTFPLKNAQIMTKQNKLVQLCETQKVS